MQSKLGSELRSLRVIKGVSLRQVEKETRISNAYLSQLESGTTVNPSPHILHKLSEYFGVRYEQLMEAAGYLKPAIAPKGQDRPLGMLEAALMSAKLDEAEQNKVVEFIKFLRSQKPAKKGK